MSKVQDSLLEQEKREKNKERCKEWRKNNKEKVKKLQKDWYNKNKERAAGYRKKYREKNKGIDRESKKKWNEKNKDKMLIYSKVCYYVKTGKIKKPKKCSLCGSVSPLEGHHDDYKKIYSKENLQKAEELVI